MTRRHLLIGLAAVGLAAGCATLLARGCLAQEEESPFQNVELLTHVRTKSEMRKIMKEQAKSLGVKCTHCHVQGKFHLDDKEDKVAARRMMKMVAEINERFFPDAEQGVTCWTCHRGRTEPELTRPPGEDTEAGFEAATDGDDGGR